MNKKADEKDWERRDWKKIKRDCDLKRQPKRHIDEPWYEFY